MGDRRCIRRNRSARRSNPAEDRDHSTRSWGEAEASVVLLAALLIAQELFDRQSDVVGDLAQQCGRDVPSTVKRHRRTTTVGMTHLLLRAALPNFNESPTLQQLQDFARLRTGTGPTCQATWTFRTPMNSDSRFGSPSSRSIASTSWRFR